MTGRARARERGFTIIEVMIVVLVIALAATGLTYALGAMERTQMRSACMRVAAAARYAYNRSISEGTTVRIALDLDGDTLGFEEAHGRMVLSRLDDPRRRQIEEHGDENADVSSIDPWAAAHARLENTLRPSFGESPWQPIQGQRFRAAPLANGVTIERLYTPHDPEPLEEGRGSIHFFPGGLTEHSVIWLSDGGDRVFSVEIHPLTGRARIRDHAYEPDVLLDSGADEPESEVDE